MKKILMMLAMLLTAVTGAWADDVIHCSASDKGRVVCTDGSIYDNVSAAEADGKTAVAMIVYLDTKNNKGLALALADEGQMNWSTAISTCSAKTPTVTGGTWKLASKYEWDDMIFGSYIALSDGFSSVGGTNMQDGSYWSSTEDGSDRALRYYYDSYGGQWVNDLKEYGDIWVRAVLAFDFTVPVWPTQGAGTVDDPYIISSAEDWNDFAYNVRIGRSYSGQYVKLTSDISVSTMAGAYQADDNCQPFSGTFDGDGHTLTINLSNQSRFAAPFKCVSGATIKNLRTAGTISGTGNSDGKLLAGLVGVSFGNTTISGCVSSVTLATDFGEDAALAGLVAGTKGGSLTIEGCVFDGSMTGSSNTRCAGIAGYEYGGTTTVIRNSLFAPTTLTVSTADDGYTKTISRDADATIDNCYYTRVLGTEQGTQAYATATAPANLGNLVQDYGMVKAYANGLLFGGMYYADLSTYNGEDNWDVVYRQTQTRQSDWTALSAGSTTGRTLGSAGNTTYYYVTSNLSFTNSTAGGSGLTILGTVYLYVPEGMTLTCTGANASGQTGAGAGIEVALGNSLYFLGSGTVNANGGNAANGGNGGKGNDAEVTYDESILGGSGGNGGNGGGGAGAGIGTRGGNGGSGGSGGQRNGSYGQETTQYGVDGSAGTAGSTAGAMGTLYVYLTLAPTVNVHGGNAGSNGTGGNRGLTASQHPGSNVYMASGGGGGGAGGFGGAASDIGTGGPGGGGGGGGAAGNVAWRWYSGTANGYYHAGAYGGDGGTNADGTTAPDGADVELDNPKHADIEGGGLKDKDTDYDDDDGWEEGNGRHPGGAGGATGSASVGGSYGTVTLDWSTQEDDWNLVCLRTNSTRADWVHLADGSTKGKTLGAAGTTTYYYTAFDRTFTNSNAGGSGLTILGTVYLYIPSGKTITCTGANATAPTGGGAGIELAAGNTLYLIGSGTLNATGGNAANGGNGGAGGDADFSEDNWVQSGAGGKGGDGGGGAGAGIGTCGGAGGAGGTGGASNKVLNLEEPTGNVGGDGASGSTAAEMGTLYIYQLPAPTTEFHGGSGGTASNNGGNGGRHALYREMHDLGSPHPTSDSWSIGGGGGGGGGGFGGAASNIGTGGPGGGGGGGGASGSIKRNVVTAFYYVGALGGSPGTNVDGTPAGAGESTLLESDDKNLLARKYPEDEHFENYHWDNGVDNRAAGGNGGGRGAASVSGSANAVTAGWPTQGKGIEDAPFIVSSTADWNEFANYVNGGYVFSGNFVKLGDDISVSTMAGTSSNQFQGTFDGDSQTLTFTKGTSAEPFAEEYCAPFRHVKNATIKNLHVAGTIYTNQKKAAGIVGESHQNLSITGCRSSIAINSSTVTDNDNHDGTHGGFVGTLSGENNTITIDGCVFDGSFATTNGTINCGGFIGWVTYNRPTITNSLMAPASVGAGMLANTFARRHDGYEPTITNCYYVAADNMPTNQGTAAYATATAPANLGDAVEDYGMVKAYANGILVGGTYYVAPATITLANAEDNSTAISGADGYVANVTLAARTLYKDGKWNTLCLPFSVTLSGSPLNGAVARPLTSASISGSTLHLTFGGEVTTLVAGTPYIIKWESGDNIVNPVFNGVTIDADADGNYDTETASPAVTTDERVRFLGTYKSTTFDAEDKSILLMGGGNTLYYPTAGAGIGAQRAYFKIGDDGAQLARSLTAFNIDFGDDETTGIISVHGSGSMVSGADAWYTLDGRKLSGKPSVKGVYVNDGRKVIIK